MLFEWNIRSFLTGILAEYPVMSTSQGTYVQIEQKPEVMRETYKCAEWGWTGIENRWVNYSTAIEMPPALTVGPASIKVLYINWEKRR